MVRRVGGRKPERELRTLAVGVLKHQLPAHPLGQLAADRQAEPEAALTSGLAAAVKAPEDLLALVGRHPWPAIANAQRDPGPASQLDPDLGPLGAEPKRVVEQDAQDPGDAARIPERPNWSGGLLQERNDPAFGDPQLKFRQHRP